MFIFLSVMSLTAFHGREMPSVQEEKVIVIPKSESLLQIDQKKKRKKCCG